MPNDGYVTKWEANIFENYLRYTAETESPIHYHRWSWITSLGACIGRKAHIDLGVIGKIFPTIYVQLLGEPATKKSTAIKIVRRLMTAAGYDTFAADKTSKEKFLLDLEGIELDIEKDSKKKGKYDAVLAENLWGNDTSDLREPKEVFIVADEFNQFAGVGNLEFYTTLGDLWDWDSPERSFSLRLKTSRSVSIYQPTISILSGNTPELFSRCFPPEAIGSGFLSRLLLIHGEPSGRKITFPPPPDQALGASLVSYLNKLMTYSPGGLGKTEDAVRLLDAIYQESKPMEDVRFKAYSNRRPTHLLRLCVIIATAKFQTEITYQDVLEANTILSHAELLMPKALGEFGKSKNSDIANKILAYLDTVSKPATTSEIFKQIRRDVTGLRECVELLQSLNMAGVIQQVSGLHAGWLPKKEPAKLGKYVDWTLLSKEEREMI